MRSFFARVASARGGNAGSPPRSIPRPQLASSVLVSSPTGTARWLSSVGRQWMVRLNELVGESSAPPPGTSSPTTTLEIPVSELGDDLPIIRSAAEALSLHVSRPFGSPVVLISSSPPSASNAAAGRVSEQQTDKQATTAAHDSAVLKRLPRSALYGARKCVSDVASGTLPRATFDVSQYDVVNALIRMDGHSSAVAIEVKGQSVQLTSHVRTLTDHRKALRELSQSSKSAKLTLAPVRPEDADALLELGRSLGLMVSFTGGVLHAAADAEPPATAATIQLRALPYGQSRIFSPALGADALDELRSEAIALGYQVDTTRDGGVRVKAVNYARDAENSLTEMAHGKRQAFTVQAGVLSDSDRAALVTRAENLGFVVQPRPDDCLVIRRGKSNKRHVAATSPDCRDSTATRQPPGGEAAASPRHVLQLPYDATVEDMLGAIASLSDSEHTGGVSTVRVIKLSSGASDDVHAVARAGARNHGLVSTTAKDGTVTITAADDLGAHGDVRAAVADRRVGMILKRIDALGHGQTYVMSPKLPTEARNEIEQFIALKSSRFAMRSRPDGGVIVQATQAQPERAKQAEQVEVELARAEAVLEDVLKSPRSHMFSTNLPSAVLDGIRERAIAAGLTVVEPTANMGLRVFPAGGAHRRESSADRCARHHDSKDVAVAAPSFADASDSSARAAAVSASSPTAPDRGTGRDIDEGRRVIDALCSGETHTFPFGLSSVTVDRLREYAEERGMFVRVRRNSLVVERKTASDEAQAVAEAVRVLDELGVDGRPRQHVFSANLSQSARMDIAEAAQTRGFKVLHSDSARQHLVVVAPESDADRENRALGLVRAARRHTRAVSLPEREYGKDVLKRVESILTSEGVDASHHRRFGIGNVLVVTFDSKGNRGDSGSAHHERRSSSRSRVAEARVRQRQNRRDKSRQQRSPKPGATRDLDHGAEVESARSVLSTLAPGRAHVFSPSLPAMVLDAIAKIAKEHRCAVVRMRTGVYVQRLPDAATPQQQPVSKPASATDTQDGTASRGSSRFVSVQSARALQSAAATAHADTRPSRKPQAGRRGRQRWQ